jgi:hypothetical protein
MWFPFAVMGGLVRHLALGPCSSSGLFRQALQSDDLLLIGTFAPQMHLMFNCFPVFLL